MLDALRKQASGWVAQIFIGLLVLSFAIWGVSGFFSGFYADTVATIGKTDVSTSDFARQYDQALQAMTRQTGRPVSSEQAQLFGLPGQVLGRLVTQATLDDTARQYGLGVSDEVLAQKIGEDPAFRGPDGSFNRLNFQQALRSAGYSEDQFVTDQRDVLMRYQLSNALVSGAHTPTPYLQALHEYRFEERSIAYVNLTAAAAGDIGDPGADVLTAYFEENTNRYRAPGGHCQPGRNYRRTGADGLRPGHRQIHQAGTPRDIPDRLRRRRRGNCGGGSDRRRQIVRGRRQRAQAWPERHRSRPGGAH